MPSIPTSMADGWIILAKIRYYFILPNLSKHLALSLVLGSGSKNGTATSEDFLGVFYKLKNLSPYDLAIPH